MNICSHDTWQLVCDESQKLVFICLKENKAIKDDIIIRSKIATVLGRLGGNALKQKRGVDYFSQLGKKGMKKRWKKS